jgi:hypothetical protein
VCVSVCACVRACVKIQVKLFKVLWSCLRVIADPGPDVRLYTGFRFVILMTDYHYLSYRRLLKESTVTVSVYIRTLYHT